MFFLGTGYCTATYLEIEMVKYLCFNLYNSKIDIFYFACSTQSKEKMILIVLKTQEAVLSILRLLYVGRCENFILCELICIKIFYFQQALV